jgi:hypothetical protein
VCQHVPKHSTGQQPSMKHKLTSQVVMSTVFLLPVYPPPFANPCCASSCGLKASAGPKWLDTNNTTSSAQLLSWQRLSNSRSLLFPTESGLLLLLPVPSPHK